MNCCLVHQFFRDTTDIYTSSTYFPACPLKNINKKLEPKILYKKSIYILTKIYIYYYSNIYNNFNITLINEKLKFLIIVAVISKNKPTIFKKVKTLTLWRRRY